MVVGTRRSRRRLWEGCLKTSLMICPCCRKQRLVSRNWNYTIRTRKQKCPSGWCKRCAAILSRHKDWVKLLPKLYVKHGEWISKVAAKFSYMLRNNKQKGIRTKLFIFDVPVIPSRCPVFSWIEFVSTPRKRGEGTYGLRSISPSIDRIDSNRGYIKGNIRWISTRANQLKSNATVQELSALLLDCKAIRGSTP